MTRFRANKDYEAKMAMGRALLKKHGLDDWGFHVQNLHSEHLGLADSNAKIILIDIGAGRNFRQVVLHEIAHALRGWEGAPEEAHDLEWMKIAHRIGCTGRLLFRYAINLVKRERGHPLAPDTLEDYRAADQLLAEIGAHSPFADQLMKATRLGRTGLSGVCISN